MADIFSMQRPARYDTLDVQQSMNRRYSMLLNTWKTNRQDHIDADRAFMEGSQWTHEERVQMIRRERRKAGKVMVFKRYGSPPNAGWPTPINRIRKPKPYGDCEWDSEDKICMHDSVAYKSDNLQKLGEQMGQTIDELFKDANRDELAEVTGWNRMPPGTVVEYSTPSLWRRFIMWFNLWSTRQEVVITEMASRIALLDNELKNLRKQVGVSSYMGWYGFDSTTLYERHTELRRDMDLLLKKHKLCIRHNKESVTLESCANKQGDKRGNK